MDFRLHCTPELVLYLLFRIHQYIYKVCRQLPIALGKECVRYYLGPSPSRPTDTVDVILHAVGLHLHVVVDHDAHVLHVETTSGHVGGDQQTGRNLLEGID